MKKNIMGKIMGIINIISVTIVYIFEFFLCFHFLSFENSDFKLFWLSLFILSLIHGLLVKINKKNMKHSIFKTIIIGIISFMIPFMRVWHNNYTALVAWFTKLGTYLMILISSGISIFLFVFNYFLLKLIMELLSLYLNRESCNKIKNN